MMQFLTQSAKMQLRKLTSSLFGQPNWFLKLICSFLTKFSISRVLFMISNWLRFSNKLSSKLYTLPYWLSHVFTHIFLTHSRNINLDFLVDESRRLPNQYFLSNRRVLKHIGEFYRFPK